jgi:hypothetical protein
MGLVLAGCYSPTDLTSSPAGHHDDDDDSLLVASGWIFQTWQHPYEKVGETGWR